MLSVNMILRAVNDFLFCDFQLITVWKHKWNELHSLYWPLNYCGGSGIFILFITLFRVLFCKLIPDILKMWYITKIHVLLYIPSPMQFILNLYYYISQYNIHFLIGVIKETIVFLFKCLVHDIPYSFSKAVYIWYRKNSKIH